jgi:hypothetical protein
MREHADPGQQSAELQHRLGRRKRIQLRRPATGHESSRYALPSRHEPQRKHSAADAVKIGKRAIEPNAGD